MKSGEGGRQIGQVRNDGGEEWAVVAGIRPRRSALALRQTVGGRETVDSDAVLVSGRGSRKITAAERLHLVFYFELFLFENLFFILLFRSWKVECA